MGREVFIMVLTYDFRKLFYVKMIQDFLMFNKTIRRNSLIWPISTTKETSAAAAEGFEQRTRTPFGAR